MWSLQYLKITRFKLAGFFQGWKQVFSIPKNEKRTPLDTGTINYIKKLKARLWY
jgi:hypothetical protein